MAYYLHFGNETKHNQMQTIPLYQNLSNCEGKKITFPSRSVVESNRLCCVGVLGAAQSTR